MWDTAKHPDPLGSHLARIAPMLKFHMPRFAKPGLRGFKGYTDMGVFWDWGSLLQGDSAAVATALEAGATKEVAAAAFRTSSEVAAFHFALRQTMDLWFAHMGISVWLDTKVGEGSGRQYSYDESGWTTYECFSANLLHPLTFREVLWPPVIDLGDENMKKCKSEICGGYDCFTALGSQIRRTLPTGPDDFDQIMIGKHFTNGSDSEDVKALYRRISTRVLASHKKVRGR